MALFGWGQRRSKDKANEEQIRRLRDRAADAVRASKHQKARDVYRELGELQPNQPDWPRREADCCRLLGQTDAQIAALERAAELYAASGFLVKGIAMCKVILNLNPERADIQERLAALHEKHFGTARPRAPVQSGPGEVTPAPVLPESPAPQAPEDQQAHPPSAKTSPEHFKFSDLVPSSVEYRSSRSSGVVFDIPLELEPGATCGSGRAAAPSPGEGEPSAPEHPASPAAGAATESPLESAALRGRASQEESFAGPQLDAAMTPQQPTPAEMRDVRGDLDRQKRRTIATSPLFSELGPASLIRLIQGMSWRHVRAGESVFEQGDRADAMYVIAEGRVAVTDRENPSRELGALGEGEFFGELGLLSDQPRIATVRAVEDSHLLLVTPQLLQYLIGHESKVVQVLLRFVRSRLVSRLIQTSELFHSFSLEERAELAARFRFLEIEPDSEIIEQGGKLDGLFILLTGTAIVLVDGREVATLGQGDLFGEVSLLSLQPPVASVLSTSKCFALKLPALEFRELIMTHPQILEYVSTLAEARMASNQVADRALYCDGHVEMV